MEEVDFYISELIALEILGNINSKEQKELNLWRSNSAENEALYHKIKQESSITQYIYDSSKFSSELGWEKFSKSTDIVRRKKFLQTTLKYAAILILPILVSTFLIISNSGSKLDSLDFLASSIDKSTSTTLVLADGKLMNLDSITDESILEENGLLIKVEDERLDYFTAKSSIKNKIFKKKVLINQINVPRGGEYKLLLSDGTRVILNSMSSIVYPVSFSGNERKVKLKGEAYFEVTKGSAPFIVEVNGMEVEVLGTKFNINAYDDQAYYTTLVEGYVKVKTSESEAMLIPSDQAKVTLGSPEIIIEKVNTGLYTSWIDGKISFRDERLEDIINDLSRWYDMNVVYENESVKDIQFGCNVVKFAEITSFLKLLEETRSVNIEITKDSIILIKSTPKKYY